MGLLVGISTAIIAGLFAIFMCWCIDSGKKEKSFIKDPIEVEASNVLALYLKALGKPCGKMYKKSDHRTEYYWYLGQYKRSVIVLNIHDDLKASAEYIHHNFWPCETDEDAKIEGHFNDITKFRLLLIHVKTVRQWRAPNER